MRRSLQRLPSSLNRSRSAKSIEQALQYSGVPEWDLIATALRAEEIGSLDLACLLTIGEVREVLLKHNLSPTVGRVRHCVHAFSVASKHACSDELVPSAQTVLMRSLLRQDPERVRETMAMRMTAESVFAALMLTIAFQACIKVPNLDVCIQEFSSDTCIALRRAYAVSWGLTAGFFLCSSLVSLASMQVFLPVGTVHFVIVAAEAYLTKSNTFIGK
ncbi:hypothetical protein AB1Y20_017450 [Prymnesium parvum]|uniref:Uncharacterized protein n=1 Tax=Prymnesium parvum TaxID=97485 RepID=A0AB34JMQ1_PRYPA